MEQFIFENSLGNSITIDQNNDSTFFLQSYDGLTSSEIIPITTTGYNQIGSKFIKNKIGIRLINISFQVYGETMQDFYEQRRNLSSIFNPTLGEGVLTYQNDFINKSIDVSISAMSYPTEKNGNLQLFTVELIAHNPLWYDTELSGLKLDGFTGGLTFPLSIVNGGVILAEKGAVGNIEIIGDVPSPILVEFRNSGTNPKLTNVTTGDFIQINTIIDDNEKIIVNTAYGNKTVTFINIDGEESSAYHLTSNDSKFFSLPMGLNKLSFEASGGMPEIYIYWRNWFLGV